MKYNVILNRTICTTADGGSSNDIRLGYETELTFPPYKGLFLLLNRFPKDLVEIINIFYDNEDGIFKAIVSHYDDEAWREDDIYSVLRKRDKIAAHLKKLGWSEDSAWREC